ncbi:DUF805 domain-containing protein [Aequorivita sp. F47161]|uniref:DUF805 domain-containing protein n=1 Tax=Aequorivita vitellina TaxID=2874475 RepID=A0A9X1QYB7_9FLAO|nr:DUF805 domain-containing protein [Aequorivita vitellina]MCG2419338.1 DUF805 domain-containing protein [Aequorivita vitellina]
MFKSPFSFNGRIRRTEFGISYALFLFFIYGFAFIIEQLNISGLQLLLPFAAAYWFLVAQGAKRCHDLGNNGFYQLIPFYIFAMIFSEGEKRKNKYGQDPKLQELLDREVSTPAKAAQFISPEKGILKKLGSELLSGILMTALAVALVSYFLRDDGWGNFIIECILIIAGYFTVLAVSFNRNNFTNSSTFFIVHRAAFSIGWYLVIVIYEVYSNNITELNFAGISGDIAYLIGSFILTYIPYFYYKTRKNQNLISLEA